MRFIVLAAAALLSLPVHASGFGIHGGVNLANVTFDPSVSTDTNLGFVFGGHYGLGLADMIVFEPGVQFAQRGFGVEAGGFKVKTTISYLELPLMLKAKFPMGMVKPFVVAGPNVGLKIGSSCSVDGGLTCATNDDSIKSTNFGLEFGAGTDIGVGAGSLALEARYHLGLSNWNNTSGSTTTMKHKGILIQAGFNF